MRGRLPVMLMALVALVLVLSLVAAVAPDAGAQDDAAPASEPSKWGRYIMPAAQGLEAATSANFIDVKRDCCITVEHDGHPNDVVVINVSAAQNHCLERPRWYCVNHYQNNFY